ncbi:MAG: RNA polymerase subunit sigma-24 [Gracilibacteraceae bacterium]|jgi:DNA-directed RNA polymerase specialized sigma24 family protein|nr:RNA polymerase subunit sigma-24 [Gracilibacteraceae bacterium]
MKNYKDSDYALNKYSGGIVYRFADKIIEVTLADYLAENPGKTATDFRALKELSDTLYFDQVQAANAQTRKNSPLGDLKETVLCACPSPEDTVTRGIDAREETEKQRQRLEKARFALEGLTEVQRRRYLLYHAKGLTLRQIADMEGVVHSKIQKSINAAEKKIRKFLADG